MSNDRFNGALTLLDAVTAAPATSAAGTSASFPGAKSVQATVTGTGAVTATVKIDVSNDGIAWIQDMAIISLSGSNAATDGFAFVVNWTYFRARLTAISGTGAAVTVTLAS